MIDDKNIDTELFHKAVKNAESIVNRELTHHEQLVLAVGYQYGRKQGRVEGVEKYSERLKTELNKLRS